MAIEVKARSFAGPVCHQDVWLQRESGFDPKTAKPPRQRFKTDGERKEYLRRVAMRHHADLVNANFAGNRSAYYCTFTFNDENELFNFDDARKVRDIFWRSLRKINPLMRALLYMGRGKSTHRIHFHMLVDGISEEELRREWKWGEVVAISKIRMKNRLDGRDVGKDLTGLANYLFSHWKEDEQGKGKRYKATRGLRQPERERATLCKRRYSENKPPMPPHGFRYIGCETNCWGFIRFNYVAEDGF